MPSERRKALFRWLGVIFLRPWNLISVFCLFTFIFTLKVKWLFGVLPLWGIPVSLFFWVFVHHGFTRLWLNVGTLPPSGPPPAAPLVTAEENAA
jgi:hypothetical protein